MGLFRGLLALMIITLVGYTLVVIANHGMSLIPIFFGDIAEMAWPGQFNFDFSGFLILSALWTAWRNQFSPAGLGLSVLALFGGILFLASYLLILSFRQPGDMAAIMLGPDRASALRGG